MDHIETIGGMRISDLESEQPWDEANADPALRQGGNSGGSMARTCVEGNDEMTSMKSDSAGFKRQTSALGNVFS